MSSESRGQLPVIDLGLLLGPNPSRQPAAPSRSSHDDDETRAELRGSDDETNSLKREKTGSDLRRHESSEQSKKNDEVQSSQLSRKQDTAGEGISSKTQLEESSRVSKRQKISFGDAWHSDSSDSEGEDDATSSKVSSRPQRPANEHPCGIDGQQGNVRLASDPKESKREGSPPTVSGSRRETVESTNGASSDATSSYNDASKGQRRSIRNRKRKSCVFDEEEAPFCKTPQEGKFSETDVCLRNQIVMPPSSQQQDLHNGAFRLGHGSNSQQQPAGTVTVTELSVQQQQKQQPAEGPPSIQEVAAPEPSAASSGKAMHHNAAAAQSDGMQTSRTRPRALIQQTNADFRSDYLLAQWYYSRYGMLWNSSGSQLNVFSPWYPSLPATNPYRNVPFPTHHSGLIVNQIGRQWCPCCRRWFLDLSNHLSQSVYCRSKGTRKLK